MANITNIITDILRDHIVLTGGIAEDYVYDFAAINEIKKMLQECHCTNSVFTYPIPDTAYDNPDQWCAVTWIEAGQLHVYGFNFMTPERVEKFETFNEVMNNPYVGYYGR